MKLSLPLFKITIHQARGEYITVSQKMGWRQVRSSGQILYSRYIQKLALAILKNQLSRSRHGPWLFPTSSIVPKYYLVKLPYNRISTSFFQMKVLVQSLSKFIYSQEFASSLHLMNHFNYQRISRGWDFHPLS
jgi:hypothetical protein